MQKSRFGFGDPVALPSRRVLLGEGNRDGAQRLVSALIAGVPSVSYSASEQPGLAELSRSLGFRAHLTSPLRLVRVDCALGLRDLVDLADRLDASAPRLAQSVCANTLSCGAAFCPARI